MIMVEACGFQLFYESFDESFEGRWIVSEKDEYQGLLSDPKSELFYLPVPDAS